MERAKDDNSRVAINFSTLAILAIVAILSQVHSLSASCSPPTVSGTLRFLCLLLAAVLVFALRGQASAQGNGNGNGKGKGKNKHQQEQFADDDSRAYAG